MSNPLKGVKRRKVVVGADPEETSCVSTDLGSMGGETSVKDTLPYLSTHRYTVDLPVTEEDPSEVDCAKATCATLTSKKRKDKMSHGVF
jgi:hypothetical protein